MAHLSWVTLHGMVHSFTELHESFCYDKAVIHEGVLISRESKSKLQFHMGQNGHYQKICKYQMLKRVWRKENLPVLLVGM